MLKMINPALARIGKVVIGDRGGKGGAPIKYDHFVAKTLHRDKDGKLITDLALMERLGERPTSLRIRLPFNDIDLAFQTQLRYYRGQRLFCSGNGEEAHRLSIVKNGERPDYGPAQPFGPCGDTCPDLISRRCKPLGILRFVLEEQQQIGGIQEWRTTSWNSIRNVLSGLSMIKSTTGGLLAWLPLTLKLVPQQVQPKDGSPPNTAYIVQIMFEGSPQQLLTTTRDLLTMRAPLMQEIRALEATLKSFPAAEEEPEDSADIQAEFYPEMAEAGIPGEEPLDVLTSPASPPVVEAPPAAAGPVTQDAQDRLIDGEETHLAAPSGHPSPATGDLSTLVRAPALPVSYPPSLTRTFAEATGKQLEFFTTQLLKLAAAGQGATDKSLRAAVLKACFEGAGWSKILGLPESKWREGLAHLQMLGRLQHRLAALVTGQGPLADTERSDWLRHAFAVETFAQVVGLAPEQWRAGLAVLEGTPPDGPPDQPPDDRPPEEVPVGVEDVPDVAQEGASRASGDTIEGEEISEASRGEHDAQVGAAPSSVMPLEQSSLPPGSTVDFQQGDRPSTADDATTGQPDGTDGLPEVPEIGADGYVTAGDVETLRLWAEVNGHAEIFRDLTRGCPVDDWHLLMTPSQWMNTRHAVEWAGGA